MAYSRSQKYFYLTLFATFLGASFLIFRPYLVLIASGTILTGLMWPVRKRFLRLYGGRETAAALSTVVVALLMVFLPATFFVVTLLREAIDIFEKLRTQLRVDGLESLIAAVVGDDLARNAAAQVAEVLGSFASYAQPIVMNVFAIVSNTLSLLFGSFIILLTLFAMLRSGPALKRRLVALSPLPDEDDAKILETVKDAITAVAYGEFVVAASKGAIVGVLFAVLGLSSPVFWGALVAIAHFIPIVGMPLVLIPYSAYLAFTDDLVRAGILLATTVLMIVLIDNFVSPRIVEQRLHIHPLIILLSMLGGLALFGPSGLFLGPIIVAVTFALINLYEREFKEEMLA